MHQEFQPIIIKEKINFENAFILTIMLFLTIEIIMFIIMIISLDGDKIDQVFLKILLFISGASVFASVLTISLYWAPHKKLYKISKGRISISSAGYWLTEIILFIEDIDTIQYVNKNPVRYYLTPYRKFITSRYSATHSTDLYLVSLKPTYRVFSNGGLKTYRESEGYTNVVCNRFITIQSGVINYLKDNGYVFNELTEKQ